jgi:ABC-type phosphate transport system substrate-binding protein
MKSLKKLAVALAFALPAFASAEVVVIVNAANGNAALSKEQAEQIFLGRTTTFPNGSSAVPLDQAAGATRDGFYQKLSGKSADQVKAHWAKLEFTGKGKAPAEMGSGKAVSDAVAKNPAAVGYVEKADVGGGVKVVLSLP